MEIEDTPLYYELMETFIKCDKQSQSYYKVMIHLDDQGALYEPMVVKSITNRRDYVGAFCDEVVCTVVMPLGKYALKVYPNRNHLEITVEKYFLKENSTTIDYDKPLLSRRYTAFLIEDLPAIKEVQGQEAKDEHALDHVSLEEVRFQLFNKVEERIRVAAVGGIYRKMRVDQLLLGLITEVTKKIKADTRIMLKGVDMVPVNNVKPLEQIVLTHGLHLSDLSGFLQKKYGVYSAGLGSYVQNQNWFIYPLFDTARYKKAIRTANIYILPKKKFPEVERTYRVVGPVVSIMSTSNTEFKGDNDLSYAQDGNGVRFAEASNFMEKFQKTAGNKTGIKRKDNNNEFSAQTVGSNVDYAPVPQERITSNPFQHYSDLAKRKGGVVSLNWENSSPDLIEPGMPVRFIYFDDDKIKEAYGIMVGASHSVAKVGDMMMQKHTTNSMLLVFTNLKQK
jgi:hypothetical protein